MDGIARPVSPRGMDGVAHPVSQAIEASAYHASVDLVGPDELAVRRLVTGRNGVFIHFCYLVLRAARFARFLLGCRIHGAPWCMHSCQ